MVAWGWSGRSGSWLWEVRKNWACLKRSKRFRFSLAIWMCEAFLPVGCPALEKTNVL